MHRYVLIDKDSVMPHNLPQGTVVRTPLTRVAAYSSVYCAQLQYLGVDSTLVGVCEPQYIDIPSVKQGIVSGRIVDLGLASAPNVERIVELQPEAILATPYGQAMRYGAVEKLGIPIIECADYMETSPLGRTEWLRLLALFFGSEERADSLFAQTEARYNGLKQQVAEVAYRPSIVSELKTGAVWYMPGGRSYMASLFADAGAHYYWSDNQESGSLPLAFETVFDKVADADVWLFKYNKTEDYTLAQLGDEYDLYKQFKAYKEGNVYGCNTTKIRFYEDAPLHPDKFLSDLIAMLHPDLTEEGDTLHYFQKLAPQ